ncbi:phosphatidylcholine/phosphatidylserine synthase [Parasutterella secunda]|jgi:CDP-diacylglycerol--serine O-phosphatidyltransferase|uniref:CDP-alcohol phosphatidyltransferase family protein n=1 Tax=Parasutterella secunda TaxID=626947 RepID=UPI0020132781|nr:phosphatidylcholine/phosphatidylserine synthase [Parasutterella secunda]MCL1596464.1 phosphatidylcholine/phosphatidylserine synthase [Parasutterella secunda]MDM8226245.1 phosphatidylcholine/phosphatidylserine synthase [Parasutterella secunda]
MRKIRRSPRANIKERIKEARARSIYLLPNSFTMASMICAFWGVTQAMAGKFGIAAATIFLSMLLDGMDGRVARLTHTQSSFGEQFDSIADMTAFGVCPALIAFEFALKDFGGLGWAAAFIFCAGAGVRLARFNANIGFIDKGFFQGLASPAGAALVMGFVWLAVSGHLTPTLTQYIPHITAVLCIYAGVTMVSNAPFFSGKNMGFVRTIPFWVVLVAALAFICFSSNPSLSAFIVFCCYAVSGYVYQFYLWVRGLPNPVRPVRDEN